MQTTISGSVDTMNISADLIAMWGEADRLAGYPLMGSSTQAPHMLPKLDAGWGWWPSEIAHPWLWHGLFYPFGAEHPKARMAVAFALHSIA